MHSVNLASHNWYHPQQNIVCLFVPNMVSLIFENCGYLGISFVTSITHPQKLPLHNRVPLSLEFWLIGRLVWIPYWFWLLQSFFQIPNRVLNWNAANDFSNMMSNTLWKYNPLFYIMNVCLPQSHWLTHIIEVGLETLTVTCIFIIVIEMENLMKLPSYFKFWRVYWQQR